MKQLHYSEWAEFGWHGIRLTVPADWNPGKIEGDEKSGSVRLDDSEIVRLEIEWKDARGDDRVGMIVDRYVEGLAKDAQKQKRTLQVERGADCPGLDLSDVDAGEFFIWHSGFRVHTLACYSPVSDRFIFIRVMARPDESLKQPLPQLLNSLQDTARDAPKRWGLYDLVFTPPAGYGLEEYDLKSGHLRFRFQQGASIFQIDRLSLAEMLLRDRTLSEWYTDFFRKDLRHTALDTQEAQVMGHNQGIQIYGKPRSRWRALLQPLPFWSARPRLYLEGRAWACPESNKIYVVQSYWKRRDQAPDIEACTRRVICHQEAARQAETH